MKLVITTVLSAGLLLPAIANDAPELATKKDKVSYSIGMNVGNNIRQQEIDVDPEILLRGLRDAIAGENTLLTPDEARAALMELQREVMARQEQNRQEQAERNKRAGEAFLAENAQEPGVKTLENGLQYKVLSEGSGASPRAEDRVKVHYRGTLIDGREFDSSHQRGEPATFPVRGVIRGWTEALQMMKEGDKWQVFIPAHLAYGDSPQGPLIEPGSTLIFEMELLEVVAAPKREPVVSGEIIRVPSKEELEQGAQIEVMRAEDVERLKQEQRRQQPR